MAISKSRKRLSGISESYTTGHIRVETRAGQQPTIQTAYTTGDNCPQQTREYSKVEQTVAVAVRNVLCFDEERRTRQDKLRVYCLYYFGGFHGRLRRPSKYASAEISFVGLSLRWYLGRAMGKYSVSTSNCTISSSLNSLINNQEKTKVVEHWNVGILISI